MRPETAIETNATRGPRPVMGVGRVLAWNGGSLWIGRGAGVARPHSHHAIQLTLSLRGRFTLADANHAAVAHIGAIVMPHRPHRFDGQGSDTAMVFVEPETAVGRALLQRFGAQAVTPLSDDTAEALVAPLRARFDAGAPEAELVAAGQSAAASLADTAPLGDAVDPRIERAIAWMRERLASPIALADAAAQAHLSPSRFRHLSSRRPASRSAPTCCGLAWARR